MGMKLKIEIPGKRDKKTKSDKSLFSEVSKRVRVKMGRDGVRVTYFPIRVNVKQRTTTILHPSKPGVVLGILSTIKRSEVEKQGRKIAIFLLAKEDLSKGFKHIDTEELLDN